MDTAVDSRYTNRQVQKAQIYDPEFQGKGYKYYARYMLINCEDTLGSTITEED